MPPPFPHGWGCVAASLPRVQANARPAPLPDPVRDRLRNPASARGRRGRNHAFPSRLAAFALYGGLALLVEDWASETVFPGARRGRARTSLEGGFGHQIEHAERAPGVRRQL